MDLATMSVAALAARLAAGEVSSREVTRAYLDRIAGLNGAVNAYITVTAEEALRQAEEADRRRRAEGPERVHPLCGVPIALQDNISTAGIRTTCASRMLASYVPPFDATAVRRLKAIGMPVLGKTNLDEFSIGSSTETSHFGPARNPWDLERVPGGASGGAAAAVAAGLAPAALGSDTGGCVRQPAAFCGVVGLRPSYGRVSRYGLVALAPSMDQIGPITRTVADSALLLQALAGRDLDDGTTADVPVPDYVGGLAGGVAGLTVGVPDAFAGGRLAARLAPAVAGALRRACAELEAAGARVVPVSLPHLEDALAAYHVIMSAEASSSLGRLDGVRFGYRAPEAPDVFTMYKQTRGAGFGFEAKRRILMGMYALTADRYERLYVQAMRVRTLVKRDFARALQECAVILMPAALQTACRFGQGAASSEAWAHDLCTAPVSLAGLPALSVPVGLSEEGLPAAVQIVGRAFDEARVLQAAYALEQAVGVLPPPAGVAGLLSK